MAISRVASSLLCFACILGLALGNIVPNATLSQLTQQTAILTENPGTDELNPYGLAAITFTMGKLVKGNFLATNWNDPMGNPGQGRTILQITPQGTRSVFATIPLDNPKVIAECGDGNGYFNGVGLTMALAILSKGYVIVGSTPIKTGDTVADAGCLLVLDTNGNLLDAHAANEPTSTQGVQTGGGPWAFAVQEFNGGSNAWLFVSYVLGDNPVSTTPLTGDYGGKVVRYGLVLPGGFNPATFWGSAPDLIAAGFNTTPGTIGQGTVGPAGLVLFQKTSNYQIPDGSVLGRLFIADTLGNQIVSVESATSCFLLPGASPKCDFDQEAMDGVLNMPIGIAQSPTGSLVGANGGNGLLFEVATYPHKANLQLSAQLIDNNDGGAGALFQVLFHPQIPNTLFFNDDAMNSFNTLTLPGAGYYGRKLAATQA